MSTRQGDLIHRRLTAFVQEVILPTLFLLLDYTLYICQMYPQFYIIKVSVRSIHVKLDKSVLFFMPVHRFTE